MPPIRVDAHSHVYGATPPLADANYAAPVHSTFADLLSVHQSLGITRGVLVQPTIYGNDHSVLIEALNTSGGAYRGVAVIDGADERTVAGLVAAGVVATRLHLACGQPLLDDAHVTRIVARARELDWHIEVHIDTSELLRRTELLRTIDVPLVVDHMAYVGMAGAERADALALLCAGVVDHQWWIKVSGIDRNSHGSAPWSDMHPTLQQLAGSAASSLVWGSDWPHVEHAKPPAISTLAELIAARVDPSALDDNAARLYGWNTSPVQ